MEKIANILVGIIIAVIFGAILFFVVLFWMIDFSADQMKSTFVSPSGKVTIIVEESCFGYACSQKAFLAGSLWNEFLGELDAGDPENLVFDTAVVRWNADESEMAWTVQTRSGPVSGVILLGK